MLYRITVPGPARHRLLAARQLAPCPLIHPHRAPHRGPHDADLLRARRRCSLPLAGPLAALSTCAAHLHLSHASGLAAGFPRRHLAVCAARSLGRMDRLGSHHHYCCKWHRDVCHAEDAGQPESTEEAHCRERRHERRDVLRKPPQRRESHHHRVPQGRISPSHVK